MMSAYILAWSASSAQNHQLSCTDLPGLLAAAGAAVAPAAAGLDSAGFCSAGFAAGSAGLEVAACPACPDAGGVAAELAAGAWLPQACTIVVAPSAANAPRICRRVKRGPGLWLSCGAWERSAASLAASQPG